MNRELLQIQQESLVVFTKKYFYRKIFLVFYPFGVNNSNDAK